MWLEVATEKFEKKIKDLSSLILSVKHTLSLSLSLSPRTAELYAPQLSEDRWYVLAVRAGE